MFKKFSVFVFFLLSANTLFAYNINSRYKESEIVLRTATGNISGTLTIPNKPNISPLVLIIAGSGPTDRDGNNNFGTKTDAYKMLAEELAKKGISSLRYDKRGIGKSMLALKKESDIRFDNYVDDAVAWISLIKADKRFSKIFIAGHSEGSLIGILATLQTNIDGFISIAGAGRRADKIIIEQINNNNPKYLNETKTILDSLLKGKIVDSVGIAMKSLFRKSVQPYIISWLKYDPANEIKNIKVPVLIIQGNTDIQVSVEDAKLLAASNTNAKLVIIENMNHIFKYANSDLKKNLESYNKPDLPIKKEFTEEIINFINQITNK